MSPYERIWAFAQKRGIKDEEFTNRIGWFLLHGHIYASPTFFVMGRAVRRDWSMEEIVECRTWRDREQNADTWYIDMITGDMEAAWRCLPYHLPWFAFQRRREKELIFVRADDLHRLIPHAAA